MNFVDLFESILDYRKIILLIFLSKDEESIFKKLVLVKMILINYLWNLYIFH